MWPQLTNIEPIIVKKIKETDSIETSKLNCFVRIISGTGNGLIMSSNPDWKLFSAAGISNPSFYGDGNSSGTIGMDWFNRPVYADVSSSIDVPYKPSPIVTAINVKEGKDQISRHCDLKLTAFTLAQVETLQAYIMEPGHSLLIEYGWNTNFGVSGLIPLNANTIVSDAGKYNLGQTSLHNKRVVCQGEYDSFFGFIVGGSVSSNGDAFDISIKLRGAPGIPTYLQSQASIENIDPTTGKVTNTLADIPFGVTELNLEAQDQMAERRFKKMFNDLPTTRQTKPVKSLLFRTADNIWTSDDFVNFDPVIDNQISNWRDGRDVNGEEIPEEGAGNKIQQPAAGALNAQQTKTLSKEEQDAINRKENIAKKIVQYQMEKGVVFNSDWDDYVEQWKITQAEIDEVLKTRVKKIEWTETQGSYGGATTVYKVKYELIPQPPADPPAPDPAPAAATEVTVANEIGTAGGGSVSGIEIGKTEIRVNGGLTIPKEKLFSKNKYIRFAKAVDILNTNSAIESIKYGGRNINIVLDIKDCHIGAFEGIYSTKPETLLIPGRIPDFSKYFMEQNLQTLSENIVLVDKSIGDISFAQSTQLTGKHKEKPYYWGKLENLYINFDLFKKELEAPNKTIRDVLETLLNEMSTAVDSFWHFQIVEKDATVKDKETLVYTVIDENWVGENTSTPVLFVHSGEQSRFLQADLDIDIPGSMTSAIISKRLSLATNPSQPNLEVGGKGSIFSGKLDKFMTGYVKGPGLAAGTAGTSGTSGASNAEQTARERTLNSYGSSTLTPAQEEERKKIVGDEKANNEAKAKLEKEYKEAVASYNAVIAAQKIEIEKNDPIGLNTDAQNKAIANAEAIITASQNKIKELKTKYEADLEPLVKKETELDESVKKFGEGVAAQIVANISSNLEKIDVVPNPRSNSITEDSLANFMTDLGVFDQHFRVFCCKDNKFFNVLKANTLGKKAGGGGRLSHPLPIKYSFTIMGKSGIRRGDTFNILGIPKKYAASGLFQVTQVEHTIQDMKWTTRVQGEYRQQQ
jgi:hypothetical protein